MSELKLVRILEYYDVPQLFIAEDNNGISFLCMLYDITNDGELKIIGVTVSDDKLNEFIKIQVDLLTMFTSQEFEDSNFIFILKKKESMPNIIKAFLILTCFPMKDIFITMTREKDYE